MRPIVCLVFTLAACTPEGTDDNAPCVNAFFTDLDGDGHGDPLGEVISACEAPDGFAALGDDCDDTTPAVHGGADEICDGIDNDCDEAIDEDAVDASVWYVDADGDLYGDSSATLTGTCARPVGYAEVGGDCDDTEFAVNPDQVELCNGYDDDCDELVDTDDDSLVGGDVWYDDADFDGFGDASTSSFLCERPDGWVDNGDDCDDANVHVHPGNPETCDGVDNDCDDLTDDDDPDVQGEIEIYADADGDTFGNPGASRTACTVLDGYVENRDDCDDTTADIGVALQYYRDNDGDGYGTGAAYSDCTPGPTDALLDGDCDTSDATVYPGAPEICDNQDNDCNGLRDEDDPGLVYTVWYADSDRDGYGTSSDTVESCDRVTGYVLIAGDCDDDARRVNPSATEWCDEIDNDCNDLVDDDVVTIDWYADADGDGFGDPADVQTDCVEPAGYVSEGGDCDDDSDEVSPGAEELCDNGVDDDCDAWADNCTIDLAGADFLLLGTEDGDQLGASLATGDFDGDGIADLVVGAPAADRSGGVYVVYGPATGTAVATAFHTIGWTGRGAAEVAGALASGDVDGDGLSDLLVGAPGANDAFLFLGPLSGANETADAYAELDSMGEAGASVAISSDFDGDGAPDLVVGATTYGMAGAAFVVAGATSGSVSLPGDETYRYDGVPAEAHELGCAAATVGDMNGDGIDELAIGASDQGNGGAVYILEGGAPPGTYDAPSEASATIEQSASDGLFGERIAAADYDGDGSADLFIGDSDGVDSTGRASGNVYAYFGPLSGSLTDSDADVRWFSDAPSVVGLDSVATGDVDADGGTDVLLGASSANGDEGLVYLELGLVSGAIDAAALVSFASGAPEQVGTSLALVPDWDGDGGAEIAIGAPSGGNEGVGTGSMYVTFSSSLP